MSDCYRNPYYSLTRWNQWQSISSQKMTPSKYPVPPEEGISEAASSTSKEDQQVQTEDIRHVTEVRRKILGNVGSAQGNDGIPRGNSGKNRENPTQLNLSESKLIKSNSIEDEGETQPPPNIVPFPAARDDELDTNNVETEVIVATKQVAAILNLPVTEGLQRVVADYLDDSSLSLLGEADAAREWIEDPRRNRKHKQLTPAFFRCWLKREHETAQRGYGSGGAYLQETTGGTAPAPGRTTRPPANGIGPPGVAGTRATKHAENPYQAFVSARAKEVMHRAVCRKEEVRYEAAP